MLRGEPTKIMPLGDSITEGDSRLASYRWHLWNLLRAAGYEVDFVGSVRPDPRLPPIPPDYDFDPEYEGHSGWSTLDLLNGIGPGSGCLKTWLAANRPDFVLLHIGTNDVFKCWNISDIAVAIRDIVRTIHAHNPRTVILMAKLIPAGNAVALGADRYCGDHKTMDERIRELNERIGLLATQEPRLYAVDLHSALDPLTDLHDGIHPNDRGDCKMAQRWFDALKPLLERKLD